MVVPWPPRPLPIPPADLDDDVRLRPPVPGDAEALAAAWADIEVRRWLEPPTAEIEVARRWIRGEPERRATATALDLVIDVDGTLVGEVGFTSFDEPRRACLLGYWLAEAARGRGLAARAVGTATAWLRSELGRIVIVAECDPANTASHAVVERCGFDLLAADHGGKRVYVDRA
ncbi:MAG: GNAT family N-acetyltransferase [Actinomycetota bacterium]